MTSVVEVGGNQLVKKERKVLNSVPVLMSSSGLLDPLSRTAKHLNLVNGAPRDSFLARAYSGLSCLVRRQVGPLSDLGIQGKKMLAFLDIRMQQFSRVRGAWQSIIF